MNIEDIISKFLAGEAGAEELKYLEEWRTQSKANLEELEKIQAIQNAADNLYDYKSFDVDSAWQTVDSATSVEAEVIEIFAYKKWMAFAAACAVVVIGTFALLKGVDFSPQQASLHFAATTSPIQSVLPDGTSITLDAGSTVDIDENFLEFPKVRVEGRVYFDVVKQEEGKTFEVYLNSGSIEVVGTQFSILDDSTHTEIAVTEGHVIFNLDKRKVDLLAGDMIRVINNDLLKTSGKTGNYTSWYTKSLTFNAENLKSAIIDLERHFDRKITLAPNVSLAGCQISGKYNNQSITSILDEWSTLLDLAYTIDNNNITIQSVICK